MAELILRLQSLEDDNLWIIEQKTFDILKDYLQEESIIYTSAETAAIALDDLNPMKRKTWSTFIEIAKQIPSDHSSQAKFVDLIKALVRLPSIPVIVWKSERKLWEDLPLIVVAFREAWIEPSTAEDTITPFQQWWNLNSFAARLLHSKLVTWIHFPIWSLRAALEEESPVADIRDYHILAAAQWIEHSGSYLFERIGDKELSSYEEKSLSGGALYSGRSGLCLERWKFWISRLRDIEGLQSGEGETSSYPEQVRCAAGKAVGIMEGLLGEAAAGDDCVEEVTGYEAFEESDS
ncbi:130b264a-afc1-4ca3-a792-fdc17b5eb047 [Sclerotinia trifoliorum]|uniref:130b264a-afc1-4ca3-a792-fdc17b5eb047 n=1 Tax=Sclerotinia trifoliorum TaxID=28548 RepID=A0A8H2VT47_9HELO|nr:130b264a-afc1-4ca3-a792-fdc17b5eb047 [Sclerotinia trifoliorum]